MTSTQRRVSLPRALAQRPWPIAAAVLLLAACSAELPTAPATPPVPESPNLGAMVSETSSRVVANLPSEAGRAALVSALDRLTTVLDAGDPSQLRGAIGAARAALDSCIQGSADPGVRAELDTITLSLDAIERALAAAAS